MTNAKCCKTSITYSNAVTVNTGAYESVRPLMSLTKEFDNEMDGEQYTAELDIIRTQVDQHLVQKVVEIKRKLNRSPTQSYAT